MVMIVMAMAIVMVTEVMVIVMVGHGDKSGDPTSLLV